MEEKITRKRYYSKTVVEYQSKNKPKDIWEFLTNPKYEVEFTKEPCYYNEIDDNFKLEKGSNWREIHTGKDCAGDIVNCKITDIIKYKKFVSVRYQAGIKNTTINELDENDKGTLITQTQKYAFSIRSIKFSSIILWLMLLTGLLTKLSLKQTEDEFWFDKMDEKVIEK